MSSTEEKNINKIIEFDGKGFKIWARKFLARANSKGYKKLLQGATNMYSYLIRIQQQKMKPQKPKS